MPELLILLKLATAYNFQKEEKKLPEIKTISRIKITLALMTHAII